MDSPRWILIGAGLAFSKTDKFCKGQGRRRQKPLCRSMLRAPSAALQVEIDRRCAEHALLGDEWYLGLKRELRRRRIISDDRAV